jgi:outer membrane receptor protein involved in Fe transport
LRIQGGYWDFDTSGVLGLAVDVNWDNATEDFVARRNDEVWHYWTAFFDLNGHYEIGPDGWKMPNRDALGYAFSDETDTQVYWSAPTSGPYAFGTAASGGVINVPVNSPQTIDALPVPPSINDYPPPSDEGQQYKTEYTALYWQHSIDVIPNWLTVLAGFTWDTVQQTSVSNISSLPWNANFVPIGDWVHRVAALVHVTPQVSLYVMNSTTFTPPPSVGAILENFTIAPPEIGTGNEVGVKWLFLGGKISGEAAYFRETLTNSLNINSGEFPNGETYSSLAGTVSEPGIDGDMSLALLPGWQLIGSFSYTHQRDDQDQPLSDTYDNMLALYTRYDFGRDTVLKGLSIGGGLTRIGSRWLSSYGFIGNTGAAEPAFIKMHTCTLINGLAVYRFNRHLSVQVNVNNILDQHYPLDAEITSIADAEPGTVYVFEAKYKF